MLHILIHIAVMSGLIYLLAEVLPGVKIKDATTAVLVAVVYGVLNYLLFWVLALVAFLPMIVTFGLFGLVINAFLLWLTDQLIDDFEIPSVGMTLLMAVLLTIGKMILGRFV